MKHGHRSNLNKAIPRHAGRVFIAFVAFLLIFSIPDALFGATWNLLHSDSLRTKKALSISLNYRSIPILSRGFERYVYTADFTELGRSADINYPVQIYAEQHPDATISQLYSLVRTPQTRAELYSGLEAWYANTITEKELIWAAWRNKMIRIDDDLSIEPVMTEGTAAMMNLGFDDLAADLLPFVSMLMEEQRYYHFDHSRISIFGEGVSGKVSVTEIMAALKSMDTEFHAGVCRDVQDAGLKMLRYLCDYYYSKKYPDSDINPDDYLFLQSWVTNSGQHVTTTLIDPFDRNKQYELDWGKVVVKTRQEGYDNGRQYGTVFRIWKYNAKKGFSIPLDARKTQAGILLDQLLLSGDEDFSFNGLRNPSNYSDLRADWQTGRQGKLSISLGQLAQQQRYLAGSYVLESTLKANRGLKYKGSFAVQMMMMEDHIRRTSYLPRESFSFSGSLLIQPRYIAHLSTEPLISKGKFSTTAYLDGLLEALWLVNRNDGPKKGHAQMAGDAGLYLTPGIRFDWKSENAYSVKYVKLQSRHFIAAREIAYMAPNPFVLLPKATIASSGAGLIAGMKTPIQQSGHLEADAIVEYTTLNCLFAGITAKMEWLNEQKTGFVLEAGINQQLAGLTYYWYPVNRIWIKPALSLLRQRLTIGAMLQYYDRSEFTQGVSAVYNFR